MVDFGITYTPYAARLGNLASVDDTARLGNLASIDGESTDLEVF